MAIVCSPCPQKHLKCLNELIRVLWIAMINLLVLHYYEHSITAQSSQKDETDI